MKDINFHKKTTILIPGDESEPDRERAKVRGEKQEQEREAQSGKKVERDGKKQQTGRQKKEMEEKKARCQTLETVIHGDHLS